MEIELWKMFVLNPSRRRLEDLVKKYGRERLLKEFEINLSHHELGSYLLKYLRNEITLVFSDYDSV